MNALINATKAVLLARDAGERAATLRRLQQALDEIMPATADEIAAARSFIADLVAFPSDVEVDDDALCSPAKNGVWVQAWIFISNGVTE